MKLVSARAPYAPVALEDGKTIIHVVCEGSSDLCIGSLRHKFKKGLDALFLVDTAPLIRVTVKAWLKSESQDVSLNVMPAPPRIAAPRIDLASTSIPTLHVRFDALQPGKTE